MYIAVVLAACSQPRERALAGHRVQPHCPSVLSPPLPTSSPLTSPHKSPANQKSSSNLKKFFSSHEHFTPTGNQYPERRKCFHPTTPFAFGSVIHCRAFTQIPFPRRAQVLRGIGAQSPRLLRPLIFLAGLWCVDLHAVSSRGATKQVWRHRIMDTRSRSDRAAGAKAKCILQTA